MVKHYIILSSSYSKGIRIALHSVFMEALDSKRVVELLDKIRCECGDMVSISTHYMVTDSVDWQSVVDKDGFFEDVYVTKASDEFIELIKADMKLQGLDIAKYILSRCVCTHLKLEKLVYLCYADYLCRTKKQLFEDTVYAFRYGPVVGSVYERFKGTRDTVLELEGSDEGVIKDVFAHMPARSRILFASDGIEKLKSVEDTLKRYG